MKDEDKIFTLAVGIEDEDVVLTLADGTVISGIYEGFMDPQSME